MFAGPQVEEGQLQDVDPAVQDVIDLEFGLCAVLLWPCMVCLWPCRGRLHAAAAATAGDSVVAARTRVLFFPLRCASARRPQLSPCPHSRPEFPPMSSKEPTKRFGILVQQDLADPVPDILKTCGWLALHLLVNA